MAVHTTEWDLFFSTLAYSLNFLLMPFTLLYIFIPKQTLQNISILQHICWHWLNHIPPYKLTHVCSLFFLTFSNFKSFCLRHNECWIKNDNLTEQECVWCSKCKSWMKNCIRKRMTKKGGEGNKAFKKQFRIH